METKKSSSSIIIALLVLWIIGAGIMSAFLWSGWGIMCLCVACICIYTYIYPVRYTIRVLAIIFLLGWGLYWFLATETKIQHQTNLHNYTTYGEYSHEIIGTVTSLFHQITDWKWYVLSVSSIDEKPLQDADIMMYIPRNLTLNIGDEVRFDSKIRVVHRDGFFHYPRFLLMRWVQAVTYIPIWEHISSVWDVSWSEQVRIYTRETLAKLYPSDSAKLLQGIVIGEQQKLPDTLRQSFITTGLMHIVAVSGSNIVILVAMCLLLFRPFHWIVKILAMTIVLYVFVSIVWWQPPVVRAAIMWLVWYAALVFGRQTNIYLLLATILFGYSLYNPLSIVYDISLHLSFLAVLGILFFAPMLTKYFSFLPTTLVIRDSAIMTISATLMVLPISIVYFGTFSLISPLINILISPLIPWVMLWGFLSVVIYFFLPALAIGIAWICWIGLNAMIVFAHWWALVPYAAITDISIVGYEKEVLTIGYLVLVFVLVFIFRQKKGSK